MLRQLTALIERDGNGYVSRCPELDITSQGDTIEQARENLKEALEKRRAVQPRRRTVHQGQQVTQTEVEYLKELII